MTEKRYRRNVAAVVLNQQGLVLSCHRSDMAGVWQIPQGGIDPGESPEEAIKREMLEEIGTQDFSVIGRTAHAIRYDWPENLWRRGYHGQEQYYFLLRLNPTAVICLDNEFGDQEFDTFEWTEARAFLLQVRSFKREAYTKGFEELAKLYPDHFFL